MSTAQKLKKYDLSERMDGTRVAPVRRASVLLLLTSMLALVMPASASAVFNEPYKPELDTSGEKIAEQIAREAVEKSEREKSEAAAAVKKAAEERAASEAAERADVGSPSPTPEPVHVAAPPANACVVPRLRGHSLVEARRALRTAHCRLGHVHRSGAVVVGQSVRRGMKLSPNASVSVTLGR
jgi:hypothetical protein